jgi:lipoprotein-anchoring transpeptidase ErfK/SrfK
MNIKKILLIILPIIFIILAFLVAYQTKTSIDNRIAERILDYSGNLHPEEKVAFWNGETIPVPDIVFKSAADYVLGVTSAEKYIEIDLSEQKLTAYEGDTVFLTTPVSTGLPWTPTPQGEFWIWIKLRATRMEGGEGKYYYNLPNVPYVMFFENGRVAGWRGYGLHGTYWHNDFGRPHSHGCVNLPTSVAEKLYYWTTPTLPQGKNMAYATNDNPGTRIIIHD